MRGNLGESAPGYMGIRGTTRVKIILCYGFFVSIEAIRKTASAAFLALLALLLSRRAVLLQSVRASVVAVNEQLILSQIKPRRSHSVSRHRSRRSLLS